MRIIDGHGNIIENPDLEKGKLVRESLPVVFRYEINQYEQGHYETIAEYPNGGKDTEWIIDIPEEGCWNAYDENDEIIDIDFIVPDDAPHEIDIPIMYEYMRYILYTEDKLAEIEEQKKKAEEAAQKQLEQNAFLESAPVRLETTEQGVTEVQLQIAALTSAFGEVE